MHPSPDPPRTRTLAQLAALPVDALVETKALMVEASRPAGDVAAAHRREMRAFDRLLGGPANKEAMRAFRAKRDPDFSKL